MFNVIVNDGSQELPDDDIYYIVAKEGVFLKKKMGVMESIAPVDKISILNSVNTMARMYINPIPARAGAQVLEFFKAVYSEYRGEAIVLLFYNESTGKYKIVPPTQKVTMAACDYNRGVTVEGHTMIGTIHSHANFSAFHSGTDDSDEKTFDGLHITFGHVASEEFSISASIVANGHRFIIEPEDYMLGLSKTKDLDENETIYTTKIYKSGPDGKMVLDEVASSKSAYTRRKLDKRYIYAVSEVQRRFNKKWLNMVERGTYSYSYGSYGTYGWQGGNRWKNGGRGGWGGNYQSNLWDKSGRYIAPGTQGFVGQKPGTPKVTVDGATTPPCGSANPCLSCKHRDVKMMNEMEDIEYEEEMYHCEKCRVIFTTTDLDAKCPTCKSDDHLVLIDEKDLKANFAEGDPPMDDIDRDAALASADDANPNQGYMTCPECSNTFLRLEMDENCPYCQTLLPEDNPELIVAETEWSCPYCFKTFYRSHMKYDDQCPHCSRAIELPKDESSVEEIVMCPHCDAENGIDIIAKYGKCYACGYRIYIKDLETERQSRVDSGELLDQTDEEHQSILDAAAEADRSLERIPDPELENDLSKPLTDSGLFDKMKKVFGGGGK